MKTIYLVRHCEAEGQGANAPLTAEGKEQAEALVNFFAGKSIARIVSSPFTRAKQSVEPLARERSIQIEEDDRLKERVLTNPWIEDWQERLRESYDNIDLCLEGGESNREAMNRGIAVVKEVLASDAKNTAVVSHGGLSTVLLKYFDNAFGYEQWEKLTNPDVYCLTFHGEHFQRLERIWNHQ